MTVVKNTIIVSMKKGMEFIIIIISIRTKMYKHKQVNQKRKTNNNGSIVNYSYSVKDTKAALPNKSKDTQSQP